MRPKLYFPNSVAVASFFGTPLAACWLISRNFVTLQQPSRSRNWVVIGAIINLFCVFLLVTGLIGSGMVLIQLGLMFVLQEISNKTQAIQLDDLLNRQAGAKASLSDVIIVCLLSDLAVIATVLLVSFAVFSIKQN